MSPRARICMAAASLCLGGMFFLPLWYIGLVAPQYPEGLGMMIGINTITGINPHDLDNINELNHYIGMKVIDPGSIPELRLFPWLVGALIVFGLVAAFWGKRALIIGWLGSMVGLAVAGALDFWRWTYDYGHNLDIEHAIIKVPDAVYQPPLIGSKQILNFTATSWPGAGVWCAVVAFLIGVIALFLSRRAAKAGVKELAPLLATIVACSPGGPTPIAYGEANCDFCGMTISDNRFGAELVTARGKTYLFDSAECMAAYYVAHDTTGQDAPTVWVTDFQRPGTLIPAQQAQYVYGATRVHSPMGRGLLALASTADAAAVARDVNGTVLSWPQLLATVGRATRESGETASAAREGLEHVHAGH